jgi:hypothetical protein
LANVSRVAHVDHVQAVVAGRRAQQQEVLRAAVCDSLWRCAAAEAQRDVGEAALRDQLLRRDLVFAVAVDRVDRSLRADSLRVTMRIARAVDRAARRLDEKGVASLGRLEQVARTLHVDATCKARVLVAGRRHHGGQVHDHLGRVLANHARARIRIQQVYVRRHERVPRQLARGGDRALGLQIQPHHAMPALEQALADVLTQLPHRARD